MARKKIKSATDQRKFTIVYNDFLDSNLLDKHEKLIFIAIKRFADNDSLIAFPSLKTLNRMTGISIRWIKKSIEHMEQLGLIAVEHREDEEKGHRSNLYTLYDYANVWKVSSQKDIAAVIDEVYEMKLVEELRAKGYRVEKEKGLMDEPTKEQPQAPQKNHLDVTDNTVKISKSQVFERYSLEEIKDYYDYDVMIQDNPCQTSDIESVVNILHTTLNTTKPTIRIGGEDMPTLVVTGKLLKLTHMGIMYAIEKYMEQTDRINNPTAYMLTLLYNAEDQKNLDVANQVRHDMAKSNKDQP